MKLPRLLALFSAFVLAVCLMPCEAGAYYNPSTGRWLSADPIGVRDGANHFALVASDPIGQVDPLGESAFQVIPYSSHIKTPPLPRQFETVHGSVSPTQPDIDLRRQMKAFAAAAQMRPSLTAPGALPVAGQLLMHYLQNSGDKQIISVADLLDQVPTARNAYRTERGGAQQFVQDQLDSERYMPTLFRGMGTSPEIWFNSQQSVGTVAPRDENLDWYYAINRYWSWGAGNAKKSCESGTMKYTMKFNYMVYDTYNWEQSTFNLPFGNVVTGAQMGRLHTTGLAQNFNVIGQGYVEVDWQAGDAAPTTTYKRIQDIDPLGTPCYWWFQWR